MTSEAGEVRRQSVWAIGNIAGDSEAMRNYVIELDVMKHLMKLMDTDQTIPTTRHGKCEINHQSNCNSSMNFHSGLEVLW